MKLQAVNKPTARQISILLTTIAIILWSGSILQLGASTTLFGVIPETPIFLFIALPLLIIASAILWFSPENHGKLLCLQLLLFLVGLWLTPLLIYKFNQGYYYSYAWGQYIDYIIDQGHLMPKGLGYHSHPAFFIFYTSIMEILNVEKLSVFIRFSPLLWQLALLLPLYLFFKYTINESNFRWAALLMVFLGTWTQIVFAPQVLGYFLLLMLLALLAKGLPFKEGIQSLGHRLKLILVLACLTLTHMLTSLASFAAVASLYISRRIKSNTLVIVAGVFIAAWMIYGATAFFESMLPRFISHAFRLDIPAAELAERYALVGYAHQVRIIAQIMAAGILFSLGIWGGLLSLRAKQRNSIDKSILAIAGGFIILVIIVGVSYANREIFERFFLFVLPFLGYFGVKILKSRRTVLFLGITLLCLLSLRFIIDLSWLPRDHLTPQYVSGLYFFSDHASRGYVAGDISWILARLEHGEHREIRFEELKWEDNQLVNNEKFEDVPLYLYIPVNGSGEASQFRAQLNSSADYNLIYVNPDLSLYIYEGQE
ncbi:hypothetical protein M1N92_01240 [Dehalococcoidia bacterium]|nr:hypothetical protein [Dehalococcoidia bacterium]